MMQFLFRLRIQALIISNLFKTKSRSMDDDEDEYDDEEDDFEDALKNGKNNKSDESDSD